MPKNVVQETIKISKKYNANERRAIASEVIRYLEKRASRGHGVNDRPWKSQAARSYSTSYKQSKDYKIAGKTGKVNVQLSKDMLTAVQLLSHKEGEIKVGIRMSAPEWARGKGNILGTYGQKTPIRGKKRQFLEIGALDKRKFLEKFPTNNKAAREEATNRVLDALKAAEAIRNTR